MSWAQRLKRVFNIDISTCDVCGSAVKVIAGIEAPVKPPCSDQADTCTPGEKSGIKRVQPITREQGAAPNRFVRITDEISLTRSTHQIAVSKSSGR